MKHCDIDLVINMSGGKDSCAMLAYLCNTYPDVKKHVVFADTGWEHRDAEEWCKMICAMFDLQLHTVRNPNKTFLTMVLKRGKFPGMKQRQCTSDLKRGPIEKYIRNNCGRLVVSCMGIRAEESPARAKKRKLRRTGATNSRRTVFEYLPILNWTESEVLAYLDQNNIPLHPVYSWLKRFSCRVCIYMTDKDLKAVNKNDPEAIHIISELEKDIGFTLKPQGPIQNIIKS